jgi:hypothetical protein
MNESLSSQVVSPKSKQKWTKPQNKKKIKKDLPILIFNEIASAGEGGGQKYFCKQNSLETNAEKDQARIQEWELSYSSGICLRERDGRKTSRSECENPCILPIATPATRPSQKHVDVLNKDDI